MLLSQMGRSGWDPFAEMRRLQSEMNRMFDNADTLPASQVFPPVNFWLGDNSVVVTAELPGMSAEAVDLTVREDMLTISGARNAAENSQNINWHRRERPYGTFSRSIRLPFRVDSERVQARFINGVLEVEMQRPEADQPRKISIKGA